jgi:hypothetical protein
MISASASGVGRREFDISSDEGADNNNKFYVIQIIESDAGGEFWVYNRYEDVSRRDFFFFFFFFFTFCFTLHRWKEEGYLERVKCIGTDRVGRWGRVGEKGMDKKIPCGRDIMRAKMEFEKKCDFVGLSFCVTSPRAYVCAHCDQVPGSGRRP